MLRKVKKGNICCTASCLARGNRGMVRPMEARMSKPKSARKPATPVNGNGSKPASTALETRLTEAQSRLGPHRQQLIGAILANCEESCFLSSRELAKRYQVDAATVVRTVQALGYRGFA